MKKHLAFIVLSLCLMIGACKSETKEELFAQGLAQVKQNNLNGAIVLFKNALEKDQNFVDARFELAKVYLASSKFEQAENELQKVVRQSPGKSETQLLLARLYNFTGKTKEALGEAGEHFSSHPNSTEALEIIGTSYFLQDNTEEAEKHYLHALSIDPNMAAAKLQLARVKLSSRDYPAARQYTASVLEQEPSNTRALYLLASIDSANGKSDAMMDIYDRIATADPQDSLAAYRKGLILLDKGRVDEAKKAAKALIEKFPTRGDGYRLRGIIAFKEKRFAEATNDLQQSVKNQPSLDAYYFLGLCFYQTRDLETALSQFRLALDQNPSFIQGRLMTSMVLLQQQRVDDAILEIKRVIEQEPTNALAHNLLGTAYLAQLRYDEGTRELNRALELDPALVDAHLKKGLVKLSVGQVKEAETDLLNAVEVAPEVMSSRQLLFFYYMRQKEFQKALKVMNDVLTGKPSDAPIYNNMAAVAFSQGQADKGLAYLDKARKADPKYEGTYINLATYHAARFEFDKALQAYETSVAQNPANLRSMLNAAAILEIQGHEGKALGYLNRAKEAGSPEASLNLARHHLKKKQVKEALAILDQAIAVFPDNLPAMELKGRVLLGENRHADALKIFEDIRVKDETVGLALKSNAYLAMKEPAKAMDQARQMITINPNKALGYLLLASIQEIQGDLREAEKTLQQAWSRDPKNPEPALRLSNLYARRQDLDAALKTLKKILDKTPGYAPALFNQGMIQEQLGDKAAAERLYVETLQNDGRHAEAMNNLANLYIEQNKHQEALDLALRAFYLAPGNPAILDTLGYALVLKRNAPKAVPLLEKALELLPDNPTVMVHLAQAYRSDGKNQKALEVLKKAMTKPDFPEKETARKMMTELSARP